jgi:hypothetical protein
MAVFFIYSSHILRLTQHNKRSNERLNELQRCLDQIKGTLTGQSPLDQLRDILRFVLFEKNSFISNFFLKRFCYVG